MSFGRTSAAPIRIAATALVVASVLALVPTVLAHGGGLRAAAADPLRVPTWLFLSTGGGVIGASFLLASFVTDRRFIRSVHRWGGVVASPGQRVRAVARVLSVLLLFSTIAVGYLGPAAGPSDALRNLAILIVWVVWWGGYVASTYLVANTWPTLNPFRAIAEQFPSLDLDYPERLGAWPSVAGLLALVWIEVTSPLADDPRLLATVIVAYGVVTVAGAAAFGADRWFETVDPVARALRYYGRVAPLRRTDEGMRFRLPGSALTEARLVDSFDEVAFVVALLFVTTYDGFVATGLWATIARGVRGLGVPPTAIYLAAYLLGYAAFLTAYRGAAWSAREWGDTYLTAGYLARRFAPALLPIAAGYHLAHNLATLIGLSPTVLAVAADPLSPPFQPPVLVVPAWFGALELSFVLLGHLVAVWVAHAIAYELFPGRLQAVRSQYGVTAVMVLYTVISLWIVSEPYVKPPFL